MSPTNALFSLALIPVLCCASPQGSPGSTPAYDVVIRGGTIYDGTGAAAFTADLAIRGDRIVALGDLSAEHAKTEIDAQDLALAPGFIDLHNHSDGSQRIVRDKLRDNLAYLWQGCTTIVTGNCGGGWLDTASYLAKVEERGCGTNVAHLIPQGQLRSKAMGGTFNRPPTRAELAKMTDIAARGMQAGAFGMSTGLIYTPGAYATTDEIARVAAVVGAYGGIYASHIRDEADGLLDAVGEAIEIGRRARCPVHISHFKASLPANWGKVRDACALVERARAEGRRVTCDQYPYRASSTSLSAYVIPTWAREGTNADLVKRFDDSEDGPKIRAAIAKAFERRGGADKIFIARFGPKPAWNGQTVEAVAKSEKIDPVDLVLRIQRKGGASAVGLSMCDEDVEFVMRKPYVATASDGATRLPSAERPHPRSYGTFPRKIGHYAIERGVIPVAQAIRSSSGLPADILGLADRGYLRAGAFADLVVFDPETFRDQATFAEPHQFAAGVRWVFVNGKAAIREGRATRLRAGRALRGPGTERPDSAKTGLRADR